MPDEIDEIIRRATAPTQAETNDTGWWGKLTGLYDKLDQDWLPAHETLAEDYLANRGYDTAARIVGGVKGFGRGVTEATIGSPIRAAGTAATFLTGPFGLAARLGAAARPVTLASRVIDAITAVREGGEAVNQAAQGNYGAAAGRTVGAGFAGMGAALPSKITPLDKPTARPVVRESYTPPPMTAADRTVIRQSYGPQTQVRPNPLQIGEGSIEMTNQMRGAGGVALTEGQAQLGQRAAREFDALGLPSNAKNINRYINDTEFRSSVQRQAEKLGSPQRYESTVGSRYVQEAPTPRVVTRERTVDDIRQELIKRGIPEPSDVQIARIRKNPALLDKAIPPSQSMEGVAMPASQRAGLLTEGSETPLARQAEKNYQDWLTEFNKKFGKEAGDYDPTDMKLNRVLEVASTDPDTRKVVDTVIRREKSWLTNLMRGTTTSMEKELETIGPRAKEISDLVKRVYTDQPIRFNRYIASVSNDIKAMPEKDFEKVVDYLEGNLQNPPDNIRDLGNRMRQILDTTGQEMTQAGLLKQGARQAYWPRRYDGVPEGTIQEALRKQGLSEDEIAERLNNIRDFRERKLGAEYSRNDLNVPGYRKDKDVFVDHLRGVARRLEEAEAFGPKDLADANSPISKMIAGTEDPARVRDLMQRIIRGGRDVSETNQAIAKGVRKYATAAHLSLAGISNLGGTLPIAVRTTIGDTMNGLVQAFKSDPNMEFMNNTNLFREFSGGFAEVIGDKSKLYKAFGIEQGQNYLNRVAGAAGHSYANTLFTALKQNATNKNAQQQLADLTLTKVDDLMKQDKLTEQQLQRAMVRMAEITQGVNENRKLPYHWVRNGVATIPQIFMRTSFQTSKALFDAVKSNPTTAIPKLLGTGLVIGEVLGDTKEAIKTGAEVATNNLVGDGSKDLIPTFKENIGVEKDKDTLDRFSFTRKALKEINPEWAESEIAVRALGNLEQSFALGLPGDVLRSLTDAWDDRNPANKAMSLFWFWDEAQQAGRTIHDVTTGNLRDAGREVVKRTPFVGRGVVREIPTSRQLERGGSRGRSGPAVW